MLGFKKLTPEEQAIIDREREIEKLRLEFQKLSNQHDEITHKRIIVKKKLDDYQMGKL